MVSILYCLAFIAFNGLLVTAGVPDPGMMLSGGLPPSLDLNETCRHMAGICKPQDKQCIIAVMSMFKDKWVKEPMFKLMVSTCFGEDVVKAVMESSADGGLPGLVVPGFGKPDPDMSMPDLGIPPDLGISMPKELEGDDILPSLPLDKAARRRLKQMKKNKKGGKKHSKLDKKGKKSKQGKKDKKNKKKLDKAKKKAERAKRKQMRQQKKAMRKGNRKGKEMKKPTLTIGSPTMDL